MLHLEKLTPADCDTLIAWIKNEEELIKFAGPILTFPVTQEQLHRYILDPLRTSFKVIHSPTNEMIGHCELNFEKPLPRLSRIVIGKKEFRNKGFGKQIVSAMFTKLFYEFHFVQADLNIFDWKKTAIECYKKVGFSLNPDIVYKHNHNGELVTAINMSITLECFKSS